MDTARVEAFSDGVIAVIITIMVLELKVPIGSNLDSLKPLYPVFLSYVLSFIYIGIYWNNHHHMFHIAEHVNGKAMWANMHLLFWLSLVPFCTEWMDENHFTSVPVAVYGFVLMMCGAAYYILAQILIKLHGKNSALTAAIGKDVKGIISFLMYFIAVPLCFVNAWIGLVIYGIVACIWFIPDRRIEKKVMEEESK